MSDGNRRAAAETTGSGGLHGVSKRMSTVAVVPRTETPPQAARRAFHFVPQCSTHQSNLPELNPSVGPENHSVIGWASRHDSATRSRSANLVGDEAVEVESPLRSPGEREETPPGRPGGD